jgi:hypothetical protein
MRIQGPICLCPSDSLFVRELREVLRCQIKSINNQGSNGEIFNMVVPTEWKVEAQEVDLDLTSVRVEVEFE